MLMIFDLFTQECSNLTELNFFDIS